MKILWVKAGGPVPLESGGKIRSHHLLEELARQHAVTLFTFYAAHPDDAHGELEAVFDRVVRWPLQLPALRSLADVARYTRHLFSLHPYGMAKYCRPEVAGALRQLPWTESYDVIVRDFLQAAGVIPWEQAGPKVLFTHNVEAPIWKHHFQVTRNTGPWRGLSADT